MTRDTATEALVGRTIDARYELLEIIGAGGMGVVFRARQLTVGRDVAVKVLNANWRDHEAIAQRFENEARVIAGMKHPAISRLIDQGRFEDGALYIVTDLLEGESLETVLERGPLDAKETVAILIDIADALAEAHAAGILHRDLKPENLILENVGDRRRVRILDFGIAHVPDSPLTRTNSICGTPGYMPPEQITGAKIDGRSDLYSLGCIAFVCLTGRRVFEADAVVELLARHVTDPVPPLPESIDPQLAALVSRLLAKTPAERPAGAAELRDELIAIQTKSDAPPGAHDTLFDPRASMLETVVDLKKVERKSPPQPLPIPRAPSVAPRPSNPWPMIAAILLVVAGLLGLRAWMKRPGEDYRPPADGVPLAKEKPPSAPVLLSDLQPNKKPDPPPAPKPMLTVISTPSGARVIANKRLLGTTPLVRRLDEAVDRVELEVMLEGYLTWTDVVRANASGTISTNVTLSPGLDVRAILQRRGVQLLAVDFFASWCKPCVAEIPRWRALRKRLEKEGFYFVIVVTNDAGAPCENPGFEADLVICDADGSIAHAMGADKLPVAHLWSWQGELLVSRGRAEDVEAKAIAWIRREPRVAIRVNPGALSEPERSSIGEMLRLVLAEQQQLTVVATADEQRLLDEIQKDSFKARYDERVQCKVGRQLSANSVLQADVSSVLGDPKLALKLLAVDDGCLVASSLVAWNANEARGSIDNGVRELLERLKREPDRVPTK